MWLTLLLSTHSNSCIALLVDVTVSPTGMREREKERREMVGKHSYTGCYLQVLHLHTHNNTTPHPPPNTHAQQVIASSRRSLAKPKRCNCYSIVKPLNSLPASPTLSPHSSQSLPCSLLAGPTLFSWSSWRWLTKPSLLPISSETGAGTMTASSPTERGRGKRGPWELQADTLRAVQLSSSSGPAEKRRLICCPCFPREGRCRRKEEGRKTPGVEDA